MPLSSSSIVNSILAYRWLSEEVLLIWVDVWNLAVYLLSSFGSVMLWAWAFLCRIQQLCTSVCIFTFISADFHVDLACQDYSIPSQPMKGILMALFITHRHGEPNVRAANVQMDFSCWHLGRISCGVGIFLLNYSETGYVVDLVLPICEKQCFSNCVLLQDL